MSRGSPRGSILPPLSRCVQALSLEEARNSRLTHKFSGRGNSSYQSGCESMRVLRDGVLAVMFLVLVVPAFAQDTPQAAPTGSDAPAAPARPSPRRVAEAPCWRQAGLTADMVNQQWKIEDQSKAKIAAVCDDPATSSQQKHTKIEEIHTETDQAIAKLIPSKKLQAFSSCQAEQDKKRPKPAKVPGPCGGVIPSTPEANHGAMDHEHH